MYLPALQSLVEGVTREHRLPSISCLSSTHVRTMRNPSGDKSQALAVGQFWHVLDYYVARRYVQGTDSVHQVNHTTVNFKRESQVSQNHGILAPPCNFTNKNFKQVIMVTCTPPENRIHILFTIVPYKCLIISAQQIFNNDFIINELKYFAVNYLQISCAIVCCRGEEYIVESDC